ncbi:hypothetical protein KY337_00810 [Candidatus Woesearchaeota archaeon]|nr:hypothetical protein [Candidatus Woesearchaeota archaeon]
MLDKKDFKDMLKESKDFDSQRELLIKKSRDVLKLSKQAIYSVHRSESAEKLVSSLQKEFSNINAFVKKNPKMYNQGSYKVAVQEYVEAMLFFHFAKDKKIPTRKELSVDTDYYLLGLADLSGELFRKAVLEATKGNYEIVYTITILVEEIYTELLNFDIRESDLRRKFDAVKYDLKKLEDLCLQLKLKS